MAADLHPPGSPFTNPSAPPPSSDNPGPSLAPKRHRRPSVRLGDIGDQPATLRTSRPASTSTTSSWRLNPHPPFKSSKTRPLTNLVTSTSNGNSTFTPHSDYSPDSPTTTNNNNGNSNPNRKFPKRSNPNSKRPRTSNLTLDDDPDNGPHHHDIDGDDDADHDHDGDEGFRDFDPEGSDQDQQSPLHSGDDVALLDAWHGHNRRSIRLPSNARVSDSHHYLGLDGRGSRLDDGVRNWLVGLGLARYAPVFEIHEVDDEVLPYLTLEDLKDMGISAVGSRRKLYSAIQKLRKGLREFASS